MTYYLQIRYHNKRGWGPWRTIAQLASRWYGQAIVAALVKHWRRAPGCRSVRLVGRRITR